MTTSDAIAELNKDQNYQTLLIEKDKEKREQQMAINEDQAPLLKEIQKAGIQINSVWDLVNSKISYPTLIPILSKYLPEVRLEKTKEGIIRALAVKEAKGLVGSLLIDEYAKTPQMNTNTRWVIGSTMEVVISAHEVEDVLRIIRNKENGLSRQYFVLALNKVAFSDEIETALIDLIDDKEVAKEAVSVLGKKRSKNAKHKIQGLLTSNSFGKEVLKALQRIDK